MDAVVRQSCKTVMKQQRLRSGTLDDQERKQQVYAMETWMPRKQQVYAMETWMSRKQQVYAMETWMPRKQQVYAMDNCQTMKVQTIDAERVN